MTAKTKKAPRATTPVSSVKRPSKPPSRKASAKQPTTLAELRAALAKAQRKLARLAVTDDLTKAANRKAFDAELEKAFLRRQRTREDFSLAIIAMDGHRNLLNRLGHVRTEQLLRKIATVFRREVRRKTDLLARVGPFELAVLMSATSGTNAVLFAERLANAVWSAFIAIDADQAHTVTVSVGIADAREASAQRQLIDNAYRALRSAQHHGHNSIHRHRAGAA